MPDASTSSAESSSTPARRVRLVDVARVADTSAPIASRILNRDPSLSVSEQLRERVLQAAADLKYRPNAIARGLRRQQLGALGMLVPDLTNPGYGLVVRGAMTEAHRNNYVPLVLEDFDASAAERSFEVLVREGRVDGLIILSAVYDHPLVPLLATSGIPHVFGIRAVPGSNRNVTMDDAASSRVAIDHLTSLGHRHIAHIAGPLTVESSVRKAEGFRSYAEHLELPPVYIDSAGFLDEGGAGASERLLRSAPHITGVFVSSPGQGAGLLHAAWRLGKRVPDELSVIAFTDTPAAAFTVPSLTTVDMPLEEIGATAASEIIRQVDGGEPRDVTIEIPPRLIIRDSTERPHSDRP